MPDSQPGFGVLFKKKQRDGGNQMSGFPHLSHSETAKRGGGLCWHGDLNVPREAGQSAVPRVAPGLGVPQGCPLHPCTHMHTHRALYPALQTHNGAHYTDNGQLASRLRHTEPYTARAW